MPAEPWILVGIDDTDNLDSPGTNQIARQLVVALAGQFRCARIVRHQLLFDSRVPYTSKNSAASLLFQSLAGATASQLSETCRSLLRQAAAPGSDPGLCVTSQVPAEVVAFGVRCQRHVVEAQEAWELAERTSTQLEGLGGDSWGVIGALAAVGLAQTENDGRIVQWRDWPDDLCGIVDVTEVIHRGIEIRELSPLGGRQKPVDLGRLVTEGQVDLGKHLRPNLRRSQGVLFVERTAPHALYHAIRQL